jgi:SAM-dependent methyltransferase
MIISSIKRALVNLIQRAGRRGLVSLQKATTDTTLSIDLIPPDHLILKNGIGVGDRKNVGPEFQDIGARLVEEMIGDGYILPDHRVLDVGCGLGRLARVLTQYLSPTGVYFGIDVTKSSIDWCTANYPGYPNFHFIHADLFNTEYNPTAGRLAADYRFPFDANSFDFIFSTSLYTHLVLRDADNYLSEMARVLNPEGSMWNTFLLLDEISEPLARTARKEVCMPFEIEGGLTAIPHNPEALISFRRPVIEGIHTRHGLQIEDIRNGTWSGRSDNLRASYQDVVIARKMTP